MVDFIAKLGRASPNKLHLQMQPLKKFPSSSSFFDIDLC